MQSIGTPVMWAGFLVLIALMLAVDLGVFHRKVHRIGMREAAAWSAVWIALAALFGLGVTLHAGGERGLEFATAYVVEKALSVDNLFVMAVIFGALRIEPEHQHRVLFWGIVGALVLRLAFIFGGVALIERFDWTLYVFGAILLLTGIKLLVTREARPDPENSLAVRAVRRVIPVGGPDGARFLSRAGGRWHATPLLLALVAIEGADIVFAVDSVPAVLAISHDPFIVFTSNVLAILGLRSLYFLIGGMIDRFRYLKVGLAGILVFVGGKMLLADALHVPVLVSLAAIAGLLAVAIVASLLRAEPA
jgi:tellurite resistance protein TerC